MPKSRQKRRKKSPGKSGQKTAKAILYDRSSKAAKSVGAEFLTERPGVQKMSQVILDFAKPLTDLVAEDDDEAFKKVIITAIIVWNASMVSEAERKSIIQKVADEIGKADPRAKADFLEIVKDLLQRKWRYFRSNKRFIVDFEVGTTRNSRELSVVSTLDPPTMKKIPELRGQVRRRAIPRLFIYGFILILIVVALYFFWR
jgi:hypothetical protein